MSTHALSQDPSSRQLAFQLIGRLLKFKDKYNVISQMLNQIEKVMNSTSNNGKIWMKPETTELLTSPDSSLVLILSGHTSSVNSIAVSSDGSKVVTAADKIIKIWDYST